MVQKQESIFIHLWRGQLTAKTSLHIGCGEGDMRTDALILLNHKKRPFIPSTSLAGVFRSTLRRLGINKTLENLLCGAEAPVGGRSILKYHDAKSIGTTSTEIRDSVSIRRDTGTARDKGKFDLETIVPETKFNFSMELHLENLAKAKVDVGSLVECVERVLNEWKKGHCSFGKGSSRGLGWFQLDIQYHKQVDLLDISQLVLWLQKRKTTSRPIRPARLAESKTNFVLPITLLIEEPFIVKEEQDIFRTLLRDSHPRPFAHLLDYQCLATKTAGKEIAYYIPGSSLKGPIRARVERILKAVGKEACDPSDPKTSCSAKIKKRKKQNMKPESICPACSLFGNSYLKSRLSFKDAFGKDLLRKKLDHVALDEFTQEPIDGAKFDGEVFYAGKFETVIIGQDLFEWQKALLYLLLQDLHRGKIRFGFGKMKGFGKLCLTSDAIEKFSSLVGPPRSLQSEWEKWTKEQREKEVAWQDCLYKKREKTNAGSSKNN